MGSERPWECLEDSNIKEADLDMRGSWTTGGVARQLAHALPGQHWGEVTRSREASEGEVETAGDK